MDNETKIQHLKSGIKLDVGLEYTMTTAHANKLAQGYFQIYVSFRAAEIDVKTNVSNNSNPPDHEWLLDSRDDSVEEVVETATEVVEVTEEKVTTLTLSTLVLYLKLKLMERLLRAGDTPIINLINSNRTNEIKLRTSINSADVTLIKNPIPLQIWRLSNLWIILLKVLARQSLQVWNKQVRTITMTLVRSTIPESLKVKLNLEALVPLSRTVANVPQTMVPEKYGNG